MSSLSFETRRIVDLRGDSVAQPTLEMRDAMRDARIGSYRDGEDPTIAELERLCAERFGKEAGIFLPTVTMGNLIACLHYCRPGDQVLVDEDAHVYRNELSGIVRIAGVMPRVVPRNSAAPDTEAVVKAVRNPNVFGSPIRLLWLENTHTAAAGAIVTPAVLAGLRSVVAGRGVPIHVDGARVFNAAVALGVSAAELTADADSVSIGFAKGLGCPVGSVTVGSTELIDRARLLRRMLGGALKKGGNAAAACIVALDSMVDRLADDHEIARQLGGIVETSPGLRLQSPVVTNIVRFDTSGLGPASDVVHLLVEHGVKTVAFGETIVRAVTHRHVTCDDLEHLRWAFRRTSDALLEVPTPSPT